MEMVIFATRVSGRFSLRYKDEQIRQETEGRMRVIPQINIEFDLGGIFKTDDPEKIEYIRNCPAFKRKEIFEVNTPEDQVAVMAPKQPVIRGTVGSADIHKEAGISENDVPVSMSEHQWKCDVPGCDREFKKASGLNTHKMWHRRNAEKVEAAAEQVALAEQVG